MTGPVVLQIVTSWTQTAILSILGFGLLALVTASALAFVFRQYTTRQLPAGAGMLLGVSFVAVWLAVDSALTGTLVGDTGLAHYGTGAFLLGTFVVSAGAAETGRRIGDRIGCDVFDITHLDAQTDAVDLLQSARLVVELRVPTQIADADGYLSADDDVKSELAGRRFRFPRRLDIDDLESRFETRIQQDFGLDYVDVSLAEDGTVERVSVGVKPSGLGASLPPNTAGIAVRATPLPEAGVGDPVEVWTTGETEQFVTKGEFRSTDGETTTLLVDESDVAQLDQGEQYRLVTHPDTSSDLAEFIPVIRDVEETMTRVTVEAGGPLEGEFAGWLPVSVPVIDRAGTAIPFPAERETLQAGDVAYVIGTPADIARLDQYEADRERAREKADGSTEQVEAVGDD
ncbi:hypothetical protein [Haloarcula salinisoli]|uniref:RCK C-terminal domain-containing protein n=1 Tax=Haloarcula salinisoli TaxID=2487746 RepID=A0A8J8CAL1_9EURY|nr:hypothetical protein [Halomicroarcula salinisoli]MBX0285298.1 hypothetical protein [Halomicroarcula salinisoli]MBX0303223.1 hypothetical protein [Halomicroarcula salinisoli]